MNESVDAGVFNYFLIYFLLISLLVVIYDGNCEIVLVYRRTGEDD